MENSIGINNLMYVREKKIQQLIF